MRGLSAPTVSHSAENTFTLISCALEELNPVSLPSDNHVAWKLIFKSFDDATQAPRAEKKSPTSAGRVCPTFIANAHPMRAHSGALRHNFSVSSSNLSPPELPPLELELELSADAGCAQAYP